MQARYGGRWLFKPRVKYLRYRLLRAMPKSVQMLFRRWRGSIKDWVYLEAEGNATNRDSS